jgi:ABC-2 type transport system ATP-binding protein
MREGSGNEQGAVRVRALAKRYGRALVLDNVNLDIARGEAFGLVGANGAGKTTLMRCLLDLVPSDSGTIELFGIPAQNARARERLAYLPERFTPPHYLRGAQFLRAMCELGGEDYSEPRALALAAELELDAAALMRPARELSKGMLQKLGLAACLITRRELYVLDEPMSGLDAAARVAVKGVLRRLSAEGRTLFFTSHVLADVQELCSSIGVLDRGALRFRGAPAALGERYGDANLERAFMKCIREGQTSVCA